VLERASRQVGFFFAILPERLVVERAQGNSPPRRGDAEKGKGCGARVTFVAFRCSMRLARRGGRGNKCWNGRRVRSGFFFAILPVEQPQAVPAADESGTHTDGGREKSERDGGSGDSAERWRNETTMAASWPLPVMKIEQGDYSSMITGEQHGRIG